ncbi:Hypothetical predicted protein [Mytilus galloprovincialis]|uniref:Chitin-binding type-2 domain-containing protein n=1 Tax=Mytilus galloprovincialis TaxID=29158 RepID=A0A8B6FW98_MYTGA|nr:Hypothetical predicted protein [Mytilus galloprovincialis]
MSYDLHEYDFGPSENGDKRYLNIDYAAKYWNSSGAPKEKIIIGLAAYGVLYRLTGNQTGIGAVGKKLDYMSYNEICAFQESGKGRTVYDSEQMVPYYTDGSVWVSFDDEVSLAMKVSIRLNGWYPKDNGGAMVWALHHDDVNQTCSRSNRKFPLLNTIKDGLVIAENGGTLTTPPLPTGMSSAVPPTSDPTTQEGSSVTTRGRSDSTTQGGTSSGFPCTDTISGIYADPANCLKFYNCEGIAFHINCPITLLYNSNRKYCDYHSKLVCVIQADLSTKSTPTFPPSSSSVLPISTSSYFTSPEISSDLTTTSSFLSTSSIQKSPSTQNSSVTSTSKSPSSSQNPRFTSVVTGTLPTITRTT